MRAHQQSRLISLPCSSIGLWGGASWPTSFVIQGAEVHIHDDYFSPDEQDSVWIEDVGKKGWAILTKDRRIRYRETERMAVRSARAALFVLTGGDLQGQEMASVFYQGSSGNQAIPRSPPASLHRQGVPRWPDRHVCGSGVADDRQLRRLPYQLRIRSSPSAISSTACPGVESPVRIF